MNKIGVDNYHPAESSGSGYTCPQCHQWISSGMHHRCDVSERGHGYTCPQCGQAVHGDELADHMCLSGSFVYAASTVEQSTLDILMQILEELRAIKDAVRNIELQI